MKNDTKTALSVLAGLIVTLLTLQVQLLVREDHRDARRTRQERLIADIEQIDWLTGLLEKTIKSLVAIDGNYKDTTVMTTARHLVEQCANELGNLERGHFISKWEDISLFLAETARVQQNLWATSVQSVDLIWWQSPAGDKYWKANLEALRRGVRIERIFVYSDWTADLHELATRHKEAGVRALKVHRASLPPHLRSDIIIWDENCAFESRLNAGGEESYLFTLNQEDINRIKQEYISIHALAIDVH